MNKIIKPFIEQGTITKKNYFEGWYFKQVNQELDKTISFIFGYSTNPENPHSFIQVIKTHPLQTTYISFPLKSFKSVRDGYKIEKCFFSLNELEIHIEDDSIQCHGLLSFSNQLELSSHNPYMPNIMGPFTYIPNMECNHGVVSMSHSVNGNLKINDEVWNFKQDKGYIEKDWGTSFPKRYIWIQGNHFSDNTTSFMLSIAHIPFLGFSFEGLIAQLNTSKRSYRFATYTGSYKSKLIKNNHGFTLIIKRGFYRLIVDVIMDDRIDLVSPKNGLMQNTIKEGLGGNVKLSLYHFNHLILEDTSTNCGIEIEGY